MRNFNWKIDINWNRITAYIIYGIVNAAIFIGSIGIGVMVLINVINFFGSNGINIIRTDSDIMFAILIGTAGSTPLAMVVYAVVKECFWGLVFPDQNKKASVTN